MSSNYPTSVDNTPDLQDGVDYIEADDVNTPKDSAEAVQTFVGASGAAQSHNTDLLAHLTALLPTIKLSYVDASTVRASVGVCKPCKADLSIRKFRKNTSTTDITAADLDAGGPGYGNNTTYFVYANADAAATTVSFKVSTAASPTGVTSFQLIGGFATDGSGNVVQSTVWSIAGSRVVNIQYSFTGAQITGSTTVPLDDTIPQITEGVQITTIPYIAQSASNKLLFLAGAVLGGVDSSKALALFVQGTNNALRATYDPGQSTSAVRLTLLHAQLAGSAAKQTFEIRAGATSAGTVYINGASGGSSGRFFGGVLATGLIIVELEA